MANRRGRGFTLIELLVVIAVIGILAAILFPVFAKARVKAYTATCTSNVKQLGMAFCIYTSDYDDRFPSAGNYFGGNERGSDWVKVVQPGTPGAIAVELGGVYVYVKNADLYVCPNGKLTEEKYLDGAGGQWTRTSYTMNSNLVNNSTWLGIRVGQCQFPSQTYLLVEENDSQIGPLTGDWNDGVFYAPPPAPISFDKPPGATDETARHFAGGLAGFVDGHAKWLPYEQLCPYDDGMNALAGLPYFFPQRSAADVYP